MANDGHQRGDARRKTNYAPAFFKEIVWGEKIDDEAGSPCAHRPDKQARGDISQVLASLSSSLSLMSEKSNIFLYLSFGSLACSHDQPPDDFTRS